MFRLIFEWYFPNVAGYRFIVKGLQKPPLKQTKCRLCSYATNPIKIGTFTFSASEMTYIVSGGALNSTH